MLAHLHEFVLFFASIAAFFASMEIGFRLGLRHSDRSDAGWRAHLNALQAALLGLLALLLGFNFAMASSRFETRKALVQDEVNGIGTTWMRAQLLPDAPAKEISELMKRYVATRIDFMNAGLDLDLINTSTSKASDIEAQIFKITQTMVRENSGGSQIGLFVASLNDMVNVKWKRREMLDNHVPEPVLHLLFIVAVGAIGFIGYGYGLTGQRRHLSTAIFAVLISLVLATILDFDRPRAGFIKIGDDGMVRLQQAFDKYTP